MCRCANVRMCKCFYNSLNVDDVQMCKLENVQMISPFIKSFAHLHIYTFAHQLFAHLHIHAFAHQ